VSVTSAAAENLPAREAPGPAPGARRAGRSVLTVLTALLALMALVALGHGAYRIAPADVLRILADALPGVEVTVDAQQAAVLNTIRAPRVLLAILTGAGLAVAGALMQGLFRNPLADPALIGVSAGAALAAASVIVLGATFAADVLAAGSWAAAFALPLAAFGGSLAVTALVYRIGHAQGVLSLPITLLAGIAVNAMAMAGVGLLVYVASDEQLRTLTFWNLGSLAGGSWTALAVVAPLVLISVAAAWRLAQPLNVLTMGEARAEHLGVDVAGTKRRAVVFSALATGSLVAITGVIGFIGLVAPHVVRLMCGPDHRIVLPASALLGAVLVLLADVVARTVVVPAELPIGILTAVFGAPFFLGLLLRRRAAGSL
jgi:iron complex transport system permease protein